MCGRFALHANPRVVALQFALDEAPQLKASYNVCPGTEILVVRQGRRGREARLQRWGLGDKLGKRLVTAARGETVAERPAFRDAFRQGRCLVPASGFYEWQSRGAYKQPWYLTPADAALFGLAGITALWNGVRSVSLITTAPNELMRPIHDRMPAIIAPEDYAAWLDPAHRDADSLMRQLRPYPAERMAGWPVGPRVGKPENDDAGLIAEVPGGLLQRDLL